MKTSELYKIIPSERPPIQYLFPIKKQLDDSIQYVYKRFLSSEERLRVGRAVKLNKSILLFQELKKKKERETVKKEYYKPPPTSEIISDEDFIDKYKHYLDTPQIDYDPVYMENRMGMLESVQKLMEDIPIVDDNGSCNKTSDNFERMTHQEIIRRYINSYTPYRGLLLFHGLGSGKTCSSISLIEGLLEQKKVIIMTPASLQSNYRSQMKFCGEHLFRKNNHWVFERFRKDSSDKSKEYLTKKQAALDLIHTGERPNLSKFIDEINGIWMVKKPEPGQNLEPNFDSLNSRDKDEVDRQLTILIKEKYDYINYNGIKEKLWLSKYKTRADINPFDNSTIIIDEAHNFVSSIVNKVTKGKSSISVMLYDEIMSAENCRVILLTGTPFINYPFELGVLFNLIHGYTNVMEVTLKTTKPLTNKYFEELFAKEGVVDIVEYSDAKKKLRIIKNPYGFLKQPDGKVLYSKEKKLYYSEFVDYILDILKKITSFTVSDVNHLKLKQVPDTQKEFDHYFLSENEIKNDPKLLMFQSRILGMVSYLGDKTNLMPSFVKARDGNKINLEKVVMSPHQLKEYVEARKTERKEQKNKKKKDNEEQASSYRLYSRSACNFVFPDEIARPMPNQFGIKELTEAVLDNISETEMSEDVDGKYDEEDIYKLRENKKEKLAYKKALDECLAQIQKTPEEYFETGLPKLVKISHPDKVDRLDKYSPKFKRMLENILLQPDCHLVYSNFRTVEGIALFRIALLYHGYKELKIVKGRIETYSMFESQDYIEDKKDHRYFSLFTGTEKVEEKEIILNIYNNRFKNLPKITQDDLKKLFGQVDLEKVGNMHGEIIKVLMITSSGAEGIDMKNTRFVHIMEPYWHHVRINQVIGRARRICSHMDLPKDLQDVTVYMYLTILGKDILESEQYNDLKLADNGESTDIRLYNIMLKKEKLSERFLDILKRTSIDCANNYRKKCFSYPGQHPKAPSTALVTTVDYHDAAGVRISTKE